MQREEQAHSPTNSEWDSLKAKPYKHTQTLTLRKVSGIVRFWRGWCEARDGGVAIPPVVARILSGDSTSPLTMEASVVVRGEVGEIFQCVGF